MGARAASSADLRRWEGTSSLEGLEAVLEAGVVEWPSAEVRIEGVPWVVADQQDFAAD